MIYLKAAILNIFIVAVILAVVLTANKIDGLLNLHNYQSSISIVFGSLIIIGGLFFRFWATYTFYQHRIAVLRPDAQHQLVKVGPYAWTRNPLYVGIVAITFGFVITIGSVSGLAIAFLNFMFWHLWICFHEEKTLEQAFGKQYRDYKQTVPRWLL